LTSAKKKRTISTDTTCCGFFTKKTQHAERLARIPKKRIPVGTRLLGAVYRSVVLADAKHH